MKNSIYPNDIVKATHTLINYLELEITGNISFDGRRTAYISLRIGKMLGMNEKELYDLGVYALFHDAGSLDISLFSKDDLTNPHFFETNSYHCIAGQNIFDFFPSYTNQSNVIKYYQERFDGYGLFGIKADDIPMMSQIIKIASNAVKNMDYNVYKVDNRPDKIQACMKAVEGGSGSIFNPKLVDQFLILAETKSFWFDIEPLNIEFSLEQHFPIMNTPLEKDDLRMIMQAYSGLVDSKSSFTRKHSTGLAEKAKLFASACNFSLEHQDNFVIAALIHDIGKLMVPKSILDKPSKLSPAEFNEIIKHPYYTRKTINMIGLDDDIAFWAGNHHEKLDGSGYPNGLKGEDLDFESRAIGFLDVFQALTESRPYRKAFMDNEAFEIIETMVKSHKLDGQVVKIGKKIFLPF